MLLSVRRDEYEDMLYVVVVVYYSDGSSGRVVE